MAISQLSLTDFRNLRSTTLDFHRGLNFIQGANGSGKTSLLEAIFVLCQAHSFRTHQLKQCINHERNGFLLFGRFDDCKAGLAKDDKKLEIRIDGEVIRRRSELVKRSPINIVNADSFGLIEGSPARRRAFIDWCLFHVEPEYAETWRQFRHALKQRNRLLKTRQDLQLLDYWDQHLVEPSLTISEMRRNYCDKLKQIIDDDNSGMLRELSISVDYRQGWQANESLANTLIEQRQRDIRSGFTQCGIHRDDIELRSAGVNVAEVLSRGQSKRLCLALFLGILAIVHRSSQHRLILLIDDLQSELDQAAQDLVYERLVEMDLQLFISNIEQRLPDRFAAKEYKMFHVEHGIIKPRNFS